MPMPSTSRKQDTSARHDRARDRVAAILRDEVTAGTYGAGSQLPPVRTLVRQHGASLVTVVQAIELLAQQGYLVRRPRQGVFVAERSAWQVRAKHVAIATGVPSSYAARTLRGSHYLAGMQQAESLLERSGWRISFHGCVHYPYGDGIRRAWVPPHEQPGLGQAEAIIAAGIYETAYLGSLRELGLPVVVYDLDASDLRCDSACVDDAGSAFALTALLIEAGCREIAFLGSALNIPDRQRQWNHDPCLQRRADGYRLAMRAHGLAQRLFFAEPGKPADTVVEIARTALPDCRAFVVNGPSAKACAALAGARFARWTAADEADPWPVDGVVASIDFARMGEEVVRLLEHRLAERTAAVQRTLIWPEITVRHAGRTMAADYWNRPAMETPA